MALAKQERIFTAIKRLPRLSADPVADLIAHDRTEGNEEKQLCQIQVAGRRKNPRGDQQGIARQKKPHEEACLDEDDHAHQQRASPLNQALDVKEEM